MDSAYIFNELGAKRSRQRRVRPMAYATFGADGSVNSVSDSEAESINTKNSIKMPEDKMINTDKIMDMNHYFKWTIYGGVIGGIIAFGTGASLLKYALIGAGAGLGASFIMGKVDKKKVTTVSKEVSNILSGLKKLTADAVILLENEFNKIKNNPVLQERAKQIADYLKSKGFALKKQMDGSFVAVPPNANQGANDSGDYVQDGIM